MNILMVTNTYKPIVGGIERSIETFLKEFRTLGHKVLLVAPQHKNAPEEPGVHRIPAIQNFNGTDFSIEVPIPGILRGVLKDFQPELVHSHHPFLAGDTALRVSSVYDIPIVFTYHTMYELNTHYVPGDSKTMKKFVIELASGYSELCDNVIAPSESVRQILLERGLSTKIDVIPTGIDVQEFSAGEGAKIREKLNIPDKSFVVGHLGRLAEEKNIDFLAKSVLCFLKNSKGSHFVIIGNGEKLDDLRRLTVSEGLNDRVHFTGILRGEEKVDAYHAMDVFAFASKSETQGLVLAEAMAAGVPVVAVDAPGVRDIVNHGINGYLLENENINEFAEALRTFYIMNRPGIEGQRQGAKKTALEYDYRKSAKKTLSVYEKVINSYISGKDPDASAWDSAKRIIKSEMDILYNVVRSAGEAIDPDKN